jgi:hypothetical protein
MTQVRGVMGLVIPKDKIKELAQEGLIKVENDEMEIVPAAIPELMRRGYLTNITAGNMSAELKNLLKQAGEQQVVDKVAEVRKQEASMSDADKVRWIAEFIISRAMEMAVIAMSRLVDINKEHHIPVFEDAEDEFNARAFLILKAACDKYEPLKMKPWIFMELMLHMAREASDEMEKRTETGSKANENTSVREQGLDR